MSGVADVNEELSQQMQYLVFLIKSVSKHFVFITQVVLFCLILKKRFVLLGIYLGVNLILPLFCLIIPGFPLSAGMFSLYALVTYYPIMTILIIVLAIAILLFRKYIKNDWKVFQLSSEDWIGIFGILLNVIASISFVVYWNDVAKMVADQSLASDTVFLKRHSNLYDFSLFLSLGFAAITQLLFMILIFKKKWVKLGGYIGFSAIVTVICSFFVSNVTMMDFAEPFKYLFLYETNFTVISIVIPIVAMIVVYVLNKSRKEMNEA